MNFDTKFVKVKFDNTYQQPLLSKLAGKLDKTVRVTINKAVPEILYLTLCTTELVRNVFDGTHSYLPKFANTAPLVNARVLLIM